MQHPDRVTFAEVNHAWLFDVDCFTSYMLFVIRHADPFFAHMPRKINPVNLVHIRRFLLQQFNVILSDNAFDLIQERRVWYENLLIRPSHYRMFKRQSPFSTRPKSCEIMLHKNDSLYKTYNFMTHTAEDFRHKMVSGPIKLHLRTTTDALFIQYCRSMQFSKRVNVWQAVYLPLYADNFTLDTSTMAFPVIYHHPIIGHWVIEMDKDNKYIASSATEAFVGMRQWMRERNLPPKKNGQDLSVLDDVLFPDEKEPEPPPAPPTTTTTTTTSACNECVEVD